MNTRNYDPKVRAKGVEMLRAGATIKEVAKATGANAPAVRYWRSVMRSGNGKGKPDRRVADAITFLKHARGALDRSRPPSRTELYALLALDSLERP